MSIIILLIIIIIIKSEINVSTVKAVISDKLEAQCLKRIEIKTRKKSMFELVLNVA